MKISILCSDSKHPVNRYLEDWIRLNQNKHQIDLIREKSRLTGGDILFLVSSSEIMRGTERDAYGACLVLHASDVPKGRGWSPHIWEIINGAKFITLSLIEAADKVDGGRIWGKTKIEIPEHALWNEINHLLFQAEIEMIDYAVNNHLQITPQDQVGMDDATYYPKRAPESSRIDPNLSIAEQFNKLRVCDPERFPAFFALRGYRYKIILEKIGDE
jgi:methionyl-tRNA formyltransferase